LWRRTPDPNRNIGRGPKCSSSGKKKAGAITSVPGQRSQCSGSKSTQRALKRGSFDNMKESGVFPSQAGKEDVGRGRSLGPSTGWAGPAKSAQTQNTQKLEKVLCEEKPARQRFLPRLPACHGKDRFSPQWKKKNRGDEK